MRVANRTVYDTITFNLGNITEELYKANKVVATGKRINSLSDDPVGLTQCLAIRSSLANLEQLEKNISTARTWLNAGESALSGINDLLADTKVLCLQMANDSMNETDRADAAGLVDGTLRQILSLANTHVNGQYIFAGTKTDTRPFAFDDEENPTKVSYSGNNSPFAVKIGKDLNVAVGRDGEEVFWDSYVVIDETNNKIDFEEIWPAGPVGDVVLSATIPSGKYTPGQLATVVQSAMRSASSADGNSINYEVSYDPSTKAFSIQDGLGGNDLTELQLLWETGSNAGTSVGPDIGFGESGIDDTGNTTYNGVSGVEWGIFRTLIDLKGYLQANDVDGIQRSITRLDFHFDNLNSTISDTGFKEIRLDIKEKVISDLNLSYMSRKSKLEDADIIEAITELKAKELAYQAALASAAKVMQLSLVDYL